jgi:hypothetical protein
MLLFYIPNTTKIYLFWNKKSRLFMNKSATKIASAPMVPSDDKKGKLDWREDTSVQKLLEVISSIIADEYIEVAKKSPEIFGGGKCE